MVVNQNRSLAIVDEQGARFGVEVLPPLTGTTTWPPAPGTPRFSYAVSTNGTYLAYLHDGEDLVVRAMGDGSVVGTAQSEVGYHVNSVSDVGNYVLLSDRTDFHQQTPGNVTLVCLDPGEAPSRVDVMALLRSRGLQPDFVTAIRWSAPDNGFVLQDIYPTESGASETRWFLYQPANGTLERLDDPWQTDVPLEPGTSIMTEALSQDGKAIVVMTDAPGAAPNNQLQLFERDSQGWVTASRPWPVLDGGYLFGLSADNRTAWVFSQGDDLTTVDMETGEQHGWLSAGDVKVPLQILIPVLSR